MIKIGCCGFSMSRERYYKNFDTIEIQRTFYKMPKEETLERWREEAPKDFEFVVKAYKALTHPPQSPTWRKENKPKERGYLKPIKENFDAWEKTKKICKILRSKTVLIQCPPSFSYNIKNIGNMKIFFSRINRNNLNIALELRKWDFSKFMEVCDLLSLIPVFDPLRHPENIKKIEEREINYFRLHGLNKKEYSYRYSYSEDELKNLKESIESLSSREVYVFFNNTDMIKNAQSFIEML